MEAQPSWPMNTLLVCPHTHTHTWVWHMRVHTTLVMCAHVYTNSLYGKVTVSVCVCVYVYIIVYLIAVSSYAHQKVVRLYVSMDEIFVVDVLNPSNHL